MLGCLKFATMCDIVECNYCIIWWLYFYEARPARNIYSVMVGTLDENKQIMC